MFERILVPLDGSEFAERALPHAEFFARIFGSTIVLLRVIEPAQTQNQPQAIDPLSWQIRKSEAELYLQEILPKVSKRIDKDKADKSNNKTRARKVEYAIREGKTPESIVNFAHNEKIDLLVICTHGWGGFSRWNISSVTEKVIQKIYLPILLVRSFEEKETKEGPVHYERILMPLDNSSRAECVFSAGLALVRGGNELVNPKAIKKSDLETQEKFPESKLLLTTVIRPPELPIPTPHSEEVQALLAKFMELSHTAVREYLTRIKEQLSVPSEIEIIEDSSVSAVLQKLSEEEKVDLTVIAAHGYTGSNLHPYGSVARDIMEVGSRPVLIIQDIPPSRAVPCKAEIAALQSGSRS
ncbi:MAG: hypothetical protein BGO78_02895 [Chloroflexi bacterium 44-23]|nr:MAG: hypothetical protein BGO78_02895 [Chloroflexi bacterium 44-23]